MQHQKTTTYIKSFYYKKGSLSAAQFKRLAITLGQCLNFHLSKWVFYYFMYHEWFSFNFIETGKKNILKPSLSRRLEGGF